MRNPILIAALLAATVTTPVFAQDDGLGRGRAPAVFDGGERAPDSSGGDRPRFRDARPERTERTAPPPESRVRTDVGGGLAGGGQGGWRGRGGVTPAPVVTTPSVRTDPPTGSGPGSSGDWRGPTSDQAAGRDARGGGFGGWQGRTPTQVTPPVARDDRRFNNQRFGDQRFNGQGRDDRRTVPLRNDGRVGGSRLDDSRISDGRGNGWRNGTAGGTIRTPGLSGRDVGRDGGQRFDDRRFDDRRFDGRRGDDRRFDGRGFDNRRFDNGNRGGNWNRDWRRDQRYNWQAFRAYNRDFFHLPRYYAPFGFNRYQRFGIGGYLGTQFFGQQYWIDDPFAYRLPDAFPPYRWVRYYDDVLLVDTRSGYVVDVIYDFFW